MKTQNDCAKDKKRMEDDDETGSVSFCALMYCLQPNTYEPSAIIDWAKRHWHSLSKFDRASISLALHQRLDKAERLQDWSKVERHDLAVWQEFYQWMQEESNA